MSKRFFLPALLVATVLLFSATAANAQCTMLNYSALKTVWNTKEKEDKLLEMGFEKRSGNHYARCKMVMCSTNDSIARNYNEFVFLYEDEVMYSFADKNAYLKLKTEIKSKAKYAGYAMFDEIKREYYWDGKICYCTYVGLRNCLSTTIPDYNIGFLERIPSYVEKGE